MANFTHKIILLLVGLGLALSLAACGKRASQLDPPTEGVPDKFPFTYPDPATDPKPNH